MCTKLFSYLGSICFMASLASPELLLAKTPPPASRSSVAETYHGQKIEDPYRYLEDFKNPEVQAWVKSQADHATKSLHALSGRETLLARLRELDAGTPYTLSSETLLPNGDLFYFKRMAGEKVAKLYFKEHTKGKEQLLIDPDAFPKEQPQDHFSLSFFRVSPDGTKLLYGFAASGSEQTTLRIYDRLASKDLPAAIDRLEAEYALPEWLPDGKSFVYSRRRKLADNAAPAEAYEFTQAFLHRLGNDPDRDELIFAHEAPHSPVMSEMDFPAVILPDGSPWAIGQIRHGDETDLSLYVAKRELLGTTDVVWTKVCDRADMVTQFAVRGDDLFLLTADNAPRFKVIRTSLAKHSAPQPSWFRRGKMWRTRSMRLAMLCM